MGWVRVPDDYYDRPEFTNCGPLSHGLWITALAWCSRNSSNGVIDRSRVLRLMDWDGALSAFDEASDGATCAVSGGGLKIVEAAASGLVKAGLWTETETGYRFENFIQHQFRASIPDGVRQAVFERDGSACLQCGSDDDLTLDHIVPWSLGGPDTVENLRVLCRPCNSSRGARV